MADFNKAKSRASGEYKRKIEKMLGRKLLKNEVVHHKDGNYLNNDIKNLMARDNIEHRRMHAIQQGFGK